MGAVVWQIEDGTRVAFTQNGKGALAVGQRILLATGALERPMPLPGWTLPGVMTAGAAQILLKQSGIACQGAVLVGSGPLLYLIATQMVRAGVPPLALVETQTTGDLTKSMRHLGGGFARVGRILSKGCGCFGSCDAPASRATLAPRASRLKGTRARKPSPSRYRQIGAPHRVRHGAAAPRRCPQHASGALYRHCAPVGRYAKLFCARLRRMGALDRSDGLYLGRRGRDRRRKSRGHSRRNRSLRNRARP